MSIGYQILGTAFTAVPVDTINYTKNELKNENINLQSTADVKKSDFSYKTNKDTNLVAFNDPTNNKFVVVSLNDSVLDKLKSHFGTDDFVKRDDGITALNNKAASFVSGWFGDIAYKREFLSADKNQDGNLDSSEYLNTKNEFAGHGELYFNGTDKEQIDATYVNVKANTSRIVRYNRDDYKQPNSIDDELNTTLRIDKNFDSSITLREAYNNNSKYTSMSDKILIHHHIKEAVNKGILPKEALNIISSGNIDKTDELKKQQALMKLLQANGDASKLTADERAILGSELQAYSKDITNELSNSLSKRLDNKINNELSEKNKITEEETKKLNTLEKLQADPTKELSRDEKEHITPELQKITKQDGTIDNVKLDDIIKHIKSSQNYSEKQETKTVGRYYEERG